MKKLFLSLVFLIPLVVWGQNRLVGTVAAFIPATASDTTFKTNLSFTDDYLIGMHMKCLACDSVWIKIQCANVNTDAEYVTVPMYDYSAGAYIDSIMFNGTVQRETLVLESTPYPFYRVTYNQVGGTKATSFGVTRTITKKIL